MKLTIALLGRWTVRQDQYGMVYWNKYASKTKRPEQTIRKWTDELMLGKIVKTSMIGAGQQPCAQVHVTRNEYDTFFKMYFPHTDSFWAMDDRQAAGDKELCWMGDQVLIRKLDQPFTLKVTHRIEKRIFEHGNVMDPVSGKRIVGTEYDDIRKEKRNIIKQVFGEGLTARQLAAARLDGGKGT